MIYYGLTISIQGFTKKKMDHNRGNDAGRDRCFHFCDQ